MLRLHDRRHCWAVDCNLAAASNDRPREPIGNTAVRCLGRATCEVQHCRYHPTVVIDGQVTSAMPLTRPHQNHSPEVDWILTRSIAYNDLCRHATAVVNRSKCVYLDDFNTSLLVCSL